MKRYRLLKDLPTFNKGDIFRIDEDSGCLIRGKDGVVAYAPYALERFNILDSDWFEEIPEDYKRWRADKNEWYWYVGACGVVSDDRDSRTDRDSRVSIDDMRYELGNYFKTKGEAQKAAEWLEAFAVLQDDTKGFKPDWEDSNQNKWHVLYNHVGKKLDYSCARVFQAELLYFATREDAEESIKAHERQWLTFFNCGVEE